MEDEGVLEWEVVRLSQGPDFAAFEAAPRRLAGSACTASCTATFRAAPPQHVLFSLWSSSKIRLGSFSCTYRPFISSDIMSALLFDDLFTITTLDDKRYDRVSRITATSNSSADIHLTLDLNTELFPVSLGDVLSIALAKTLSTDSTSASTSSSGWREPKPGERGLADDYDYVMYGTVYKFEEGKNENM